MQSFVILTTASNASASLSSLYVSNEGDLNGAEQLRAGDRCHSRRS
jgi:hypothetical protein